MSSSIYTYTQMYPMSCVLAPSGCPFEREAIYFCIYMCQAYSAS